MGTSSLSLLKTRRFLPLFVAQTFGAVNDNMLKNALVVLVLFQLAEAGPSLVALSGGAFILPYALFSSLAGQMADRFEKSRLIRWTKGFELLVMSLAAIGFLTDNLALLGVVLMGLGTQATFFSPLKYGILPDHLSESEIVAGNGLIEAGTFLGILAGTIFGGAVIMLRHGAAITAIAGLVVALIGLAGAFTIPCAKIAAPDLRLEWNVIRETAAVILQAKGNRPVWLSILGLSWFWTIGATLLSEFPVVAQRVLGADEHVVTLQLAVFAIGVGTGSVLCARLLRGEVSARHVPYAALGLSYFTWDFAAHCAAGADTHLSSVSSLLTSLTGWHLLGDLFLLALCGGVYSVPLYVILQERSAPECRSRMVACNNVVNAAFMVLGAGVAAGLAAIGWSAPHILILAAIANLLVSLWIINLLPQEMIQVALRWFFETCHGVEVSGLEHYKEAGDRAVVVVNHQSFIDGLLVAAFLPDAPTFAVNTHMTGKWWAKPFLMPIDVFPVDPANPYSAKAMVRAVSEGRKLVIFPEGRITKTGALMKVYEGAGMVADKAGATIVPIRIDGLQFTPFSHMQGKLRRRLFPRLKLTILPPVTLQIDPALRGRKRRQKVGTILQDQMVASAFASYDTNRSLFAALLDAQHRYGAATPIIEDVERISMARFGRRPYSSHLVALFSDCGDDGRQ